MVFKLCAAALWGAVRNLKGAANFFRQDEILQFFYRNLLGCAGKKFWSLSGCREQKSLKTTDLQLMAFLQRFASKSINKWLTYNQKNVERHQISRQNRQPIGQVLLF